MTLPPDPENMNDARAEWADFALSHFIANTGVDREDALSDLLVDLMHLCDRTEFDFNVQLERARLDYSAETEAA